MLAESAMIQLESLELPTQGLKQMLTGRFPRVKGYLAHGSFGLLIFTLATITATGQTFTTLANFSGTNGKQPDNIIQATDGNFYGTTYEGGVGNFGTIFRMTPSGAITTIHTFNGLDGNQPTPGLIQGSDGNLYGTTQGDETHTYGTVFKSTLNGALTTLHSFATAGAEGQYPTALIEASDGNFYGTTTAGGIPIPSGIESGWGVVFKVTPPGVFTVLHAFDGNDGDTPSSLVQASDGNLYGTTGGGFGANAGGTVFRLTPAGALTNLYADPSPSGGGFSNLLQGADGSLYGAMASGAFKMTLQGAFTPLCNGGEVTISLGGRSFTNVTKANRSRVSFRLPTATSMGPKPTASSRCFPMAR